MSYTTTMLPGLGMSTISEWGDTPANELSGLRMSTISEWGDTPANKLSGLRMSTIAEWVIHQPMNCLV